MKNLAIVTSCLAIVSAVVSLSGCEAKEPIALDPELQRQLKEYDKMMDEKESAHIYRRQPAKVVPASTDSSEGSPANLDENTKAAEINSVDRLGKFSTPNDVCDAFLKALNDGDHISAGQMLTNVAQLETARANLILESPGEPGTDIEVLPARYATSAKQVAQVECILKQPNSSEPPIRLTWLMRFQYNGWKISGMSIHMDASDTGDLLSFENPRDVARIQQSVEATDEVQNEEVTANGGETVDSINR